MSLSHPSRLSLGDFIRQNQASELAEPAEAMADPDLPIQRRLEALAKAGDAEGLRQALADNPTVNPALAVSAAAAAGHPEALRVALEPFEPEDFHPMAAALAIQYGHDECLALLARKTFSEHQCDALRLCAIHERPTAAKILLDTGVCHPQTPFSEDVPNLGHRDPVAWAAALGHIKTLRALLAARAANPAEARSLGSALRLAGEAGGTQNESGRALCFEELLPLLSPSELLDQLSPIVERGGFESAQLMLEALPLEAADAKGRGPIEILIEAANSWRFAAEPHPDDDYAFGDSLPELRAERSVNGVNECLALIHRAILSGRSARAENGAVNCVQIAENGPLSDTLPDLMRAWEAQAEALALERVAGPAAPALKKGPAL